MNIDVPVREEGGDRGGGSRGGTMSLPAWARWLHLYGSMLGLGALLFFSLTGITLNHPDWKLGSRQRTEKAGGRLEARWLAEGRGEEAVDRLAIAEAVRQAHGLRGAVEDFRVDEKECSLVFKGPGTSADVVVDRHTGRYTVESIREGWVAVMNDLHKGRHTGSVWSWVLDVSAGVLALVSGSGLWLLWYVRRRRASGLWVGLIGLLGLVAGAVWWVR